jgi:type II secretory pathway pseudopilin PulG
MPSRRGTTVVEVLIVIGVVLILIAILLPALRGVRETASHVICSTRLRDLALASQLYYQDHARYPEPCVEVVSTSNGTRGRVMPHQVQRRLLNRLQPYLKYGEVEPGAPAERLPPHVQTPAAERVRNGRGPRRTNELDAETEHYYTGYAYVARLDEWSLSGVDPQSTLPAGVGILLQTDRAAGMRQPRGVVWVDELHWNQSEGTWRYSHSRAGSITNGLPFTHRSHQHLIGQHRAYTDGSVEWVRPSRLNPDDLPVGTEPDGSPAYRMDLLFWWF